MFSYQLIFSMILIPQMIDPLEWTHSLWLDDSHQSHNKLNHYENTPKYHLNWKFDDQKQIITFLAEVQTRGWIGFGISNSGGMTNSDLVIGWVNDNGTAALYDCFAYNESMPIIDESQDWKLLEWAQNETHTNLQFSRPYKTCDDDNDLEISSETTHKLIYGFGDKNPKCIDNVEKHIMKGTIKLLLLQDNFEKLVDFQDKDLQYFDFTVENVTIPKQPVSYWCRLFKVQFPVKRQIIQISPKITPGNENIIHHLIVYSCGHPDSSKLDQFLNYGSFDCSRTAFLPQDLRYCIRGYFSWAVGGQPFRPPVEAGYAFGADDETTYFLFQIHYQNMDLVENRLDFSGLRTHHTSKIRPNDVFMMATGSVIEYGLIIPPKQPNFIVAGHCSPKCYNKFMPNRQNGIKVYGILIHSHLIATGIKVRHFRGNEELPPIINDKTFDFTFQQNRILKKPVTILPNDQITTECTYNSSTRNFTTNGGESSLQEMCAAGILYYPWMRNFSNMCLSGITQSTMLSVSGLEGISGFGSKNPIIERPEHLKNSSLLKYLADKQDWSYETQYKTRFNEHRMECYFAKTPTDTGPDKFVSYPKNLKEYIPPEVKCQKPSGK